MFPKMQIFQVQFAFLDVFIRLWKILKFYWRFLEASKNPRSGIQDDHCLKIVTVIRSNQGPQWKYLWTFYANSKLRVEGCMGVRL